MKDDYIAAFGAVKDVGHFVDEHVFAALEAWLHADAVYKIILYGKTNDGEDEKRERYRFNDFSC